MTLFTPLTLQYSIYNKLFTSLQYKKTYDEINMYCINWDFNSYFIVLFTRLLTIQKLFIFFVICLFFIRPQTRYNTKEVDLLITVYNLSTTYNLPRAEKKEKLQFTKTLLGLSYLKQGNSTYKKEYLEGLIYNTLLSIYD